MEVTFLGAVREVTGSLHRLNCCGNEVLLDCGLFQGRRKESERKNREFPVDPHTVTNVILSHAHIDHSGRLPLLVKGGFAGRILATRATTDACTYLLPDSAHIQESDALYLNYKTARAFLYRQEHKKKGKSITHRQAREIKRALKRDEHRLNGEAIDEVLHRYDLPAVRPLYTMDDAEATLEYFDPYPYHTPVTVGRHLTCTFYDAGHILGAAISVVEGTEKGRTTRICFTGDLGRFRKPILKDPTLEFAEEHRTVDLLIMESTYGNRLHDPVEGLAKRLAEVVRETHERGGCILVPSFAYGRTQELVYVLHKLYEEGRTPRLPIYVDSPLAVKLTKVFGEHPENYDRAAHADFLEKGMNPFAFPEIHFVSALEESMALMKEQKPHIVLSASGMCEAGRILHHLRYKIHNPRNTILIVGFMARNTLGRRILERGLRYEALGRTGPPPEMKFLGKVYPLKARVVSLDGFSAHADRKELVRFLKRSNLEVKRIALVHGEEEQSLGLQDRLRRDGYTVFVPKPGDTVQV